MRFPLHGLLLLALACEAEGTHLTSVQVVSDSPAWVDWAAWDPRAESYLDGGNISLVDGGMCIAVAPERRPLVIVIFVEAAGGEP